MSAVVQISAGTGPEPVRRFVAALARHLLERCEASGEVVLDVLRRGDSSAPLSVTIHLEVMPPWLVALVGTHALVARSADRGKRSRKRWFAGVRVTDLPARESSRRLQRDDVQLSTMRASGPGGQHVNKTCSAVRLVHGASGLSVRACDERSQKANLRLALERLRTALDELESARVARVEAGLRSEHHRIDRGRPVATYVLDHRGELCHAP
jgi:putative peptide chain release factor H